MAVKKHSSKRTSAPAQRNEAQAPPKLAAVSTPERITFINVDRGLSHLGDLLTIGQSLPTLMPKNGSMDIDAETRDAVVDDLLRSADDVISAIKLYGLLMTGQGKDDLDAHSVEELGYTLHGLGRIAVQLLRAVDEVRGTYLATEAAHG